MTVLLEYFVFEGIHVHSINKALYINNTLRSMSSDNRGATVIQSLLIFRLLYFQLTIINKYH